MGVDETEIGFRCVRLTPALRDQLQICLNSVENLAALDLPIEARRCVASVERADIRVHPVDLAL